MVELFVVCQKLLIGQIGDARRVTAGFIAVAGVREQQRIHRAFHHGVGGAVRALHLIEHNPLIHRGVAQFIAPALLPENFRLVIDCRMQHGIQIDIHQVQEIAVVAAGNRVHRLVGVGHCVQESLHRGFQQIDKRLLDRVFVRPAQHRVFQNMKHAGGVLRYRFKRNRKGFVFIGAVQPAELRAGFFVFQLPELGCQLRQLTDTLHGKAVQICTRLHSVSPILFLSSDR